MCCHVYLPYFERLLALSIQTVPNGLGSITGQNLCRHLYSYIDLNQTKVCKRWVKLPSRWSYLVISLHHGQGHSVGLSVSFRKYLETFSHVHNMDTVCITMNKEMSSVCLQSQVHLDDIDTLASLLPSLLSLSPVE